MENMMVTGIAKFFDSTRGSGFIGPDDGSKHVFVHISAVESTGMTPLVEKQKVSFDLQKSNDGKSSATHLKAA